MHHHIDACVHAVQADRLDRLVATAAAGDEVAWRTLVSRFGPRLLRLARSQGLNRQEAEDAVQETWVRLLRNITRVREPLALGGWLATTARHESLRVRERARREEPTDDELCSEAAANEAVEQQLDASECRVAVGRALEALPARHRRLMLALFAESDSSYGEIAHQLEMPVGSIGPIRGRCLAQLRRDGRLRRLAEQLD
jgi:RNA polymerase sigma factor (sigma-70 family)